LYFVHVPSVLVLCNDIIIFTSSIELLFGLQLSDNDCTAIGDDDDTLLVVVVAVVILLLVLLISDDNLINYFCIHFCTCIILI
jgi:hypothetical protein